MERKSLAACGEAIIAKSVPTMSQQRRAPRRDPRRGEIPMRSNALTGRCVPEEVILPSGGIVDKYGRKAKRLKRQPGGRMPERICGRLFTYERNLK